MPKSCSQSCCGVSLLLICKLPVCMAQKKIQTTLSGISCKMRACKFLSKCRKVQEGLFGSEFLNTVNLVTSKLKQNKTSEENDQTLNVTCECVMLSSIVRKGIQPVIFNSLLCRFLIYIYICGIYKCIPMLIIIKYAAGLPLKLQLWQVTVSGRCF